MLRSQLEYTLYYAKVSSEQIQIRAIKLIICIKHLQYVERLQGIKPTYHEILMSLYST